MRTIFLHGLESGPWGSKARALREQYPDVASPDCTGVIDLDQRVALALAEVDKTDDHVVLVGSSFGGLVALHAAKRRSDRVVALLLLAPALHYGEQVPTVSCPVVIMHGDADDVVPITASRNYPAPLIELSGVGHRLEGCESLMLDQLNSLFKNLSQATTSLSLD